MAFDVDGALAELLRSRARPEGLTWLEQVIADVAAGADPEVAFPAVGRHVGRGGLDVPGATLTTATGEVVPLAAWRVDDAARVRVLLAAARHDAAGALATAARLYAQGDARERTGALRALPFLPGAADDAAALPAVLDAMRVTQGEIFEAAICDNPYGSRHLPQLEWRKAVLKALFVGLSIHRIPGLDDRADADLAQSLCDFAAEREAATRAVPPELWPLAARHAPPGLAAKLIGYLEHPNPVHRAAAATALGHVVATDARVRPFLTDRAERERDDVVAAALRGALARG
ncbi:MAG: HEAT repeat domain-containing protein [Kofleriaceae bacterium]|nr:HEAT repeat domain-containing protein [Kofleriaceae bacterium]